MARCLWSIFNVTSGVCIQRRDTFGAKERFSYWWSADSHKDQLPVSCTSAVQLSRSSSMALVQLTKDPCAPVGLYRDATGSCSDGFSEFKLFSMLWSKRLGTNHQEAPMQGACSLITKQRLTGLGQGLDGFADQDPKIQEQRHLPEI